MAQDAPTRIPPAVDNRPTRATANAIARAKSAPASRSRQRRGSLRKLNAELGRFDSRSARQPVNYLGSDSGPAPALSSGADDAPAKRGEPQAAENRARPRPREGYQR